MPLSPKRTHVVRMGFLRLWLRIIARFGFLSLPLVLFADFALVASGRVPQISGAHVIIAQLPQSHSRTAVIVALIAGSFVVDMIVAGFACPLLLLNSRLRHWLVEKISQNMAQQRTQEVAQQRTMAVVSYLVKIPRNLRRRLVQFSRNEAGLRETPYIVCRKACHSAQVRYRPLFQVRKWFGDPLAQRQTANFDIKKHAVLDSLNDILVTQIALALDVDIKPLFGEDAWFADFVTENWRQKTLLDDGGDLPLRYSQATPHSRFVDHSKENPDGHSTMREAPLDGERPKAKYLIICCLTNPIKDPVYVLPVAALVRRFNEKYGERAASYISALLKNVTPMFATIKSGEHDGEIADDVLEMYHRYDRQVLSQYQGGYRSGFDPNRIDYSAMSDRSEARKALVAFSQTIDEAIVDKAASDEVKVKLRAGDVLIVNNYYALHRRVELGYKSMRRPLLFAKRRRWLRVYYAFSRPEFV